LGAQVVGISTDFVPANTAWAEKMGVTFPLVSDMPRTTLQAYDFLDSDPKSRLYRYAKRAYAVIDKTGTVRYVKVLQSAKELVTDDELLAELDKLK
jgi:peroxiredoxin